MGTGIFLTGTDTDVGKTVVATGIVAAGRRRGIEPGVLKPVSAGGREDAVALRSAAGITDSIERVNPIALRDPLSPDIAARREGVRIDYDDLVTQCRAALGRRTWTLVEGAGGILVPITETRDMGDLASDLALPVVIVARAALGTINHTRLTIEAVRGRGLSVLGIIYNASGPEQTGPAAQDSPGSVLRTTGVQSLGSVPFLPGPGTLEDADRLADAIEEHVDLTSLFAAST